uniref:Uncharacterized protein n=1 Tax=Kwoniella bestiolae CBS 10118 TaxID=1296100 RepID=A0A1B9FSJ0_9TREE|nr:hypothetical protein I302_08509 [Kwoniella bestiolae CBS 10118]OCF21732.1 hypothetical protein I302_08509 [Kwoniella bestiolae CBS 10118]
MVFGSWLQGVAEGVNRGSLQGSTNRMLQDINGAAENSTNMGPIWHRKNCGEMRRRSGRTLPPWIELQAVQLKWAGVKNNAKSNANSSGSGSGKMGRANSAGQ